MNDEIVVNGVRVGLTTDLAALIKRQLSDGSLLAGRYDDKPEQGIWSLFTAADGTALEPRLIDAVKTLLTDPDPRIRSGAIGLAQAFAEKFQAQDLLDILRSHQDLFHAVKESGSDETDLAWGLLRAIAGSSNWTPEVAKELRSAVKDQINGLNVLAGVVNHDANWVVDHATEVIDGQAARARVVLFRMKDPELRERLVRRIPRESPGLRRLVAGAVSDEIKDPAEKERLMKILVGSYEPGP